MRDEARALISTGIDPQEYKKEKAIKKQADNANTFQNIAIDWFNIEKSKNYVENTLYKKWAFLSNHVFPIMANVSISKITPNLLITALQPLKSVGKLSTIRRTCQIVNNVMTYAINRGLITHNPLANIITVFDSPVETNRPTIAPSELPEFMKALSLVSIF